MVMNLKRSIRQFMLVVAALLSAQMLMWAQNEIPTKVTPQNRTGELPFSTTIGSEVERVDVLTGNLMLNIPFDTKPGRGMNSSVGLYYNSLAWRSAPRVDGGGTPIFVWTPEQTDGIAFGWNETRPR